jgi:hypothetical protein
MKPKLDKSEKFEIQRQSWEKKRQRGKQSFAIRYGVLGWGGFMFIVTNCTNVFIHHQKLDWFLPINAAFWVLAGYFWGLWMWRRFDEKFHGPANQPPSITRNQIQ